MAFGNLDYTERLEEENKAMKEVISRLEGVQKMKEQEDKANKEKTALGPSPLERCLCFRCEHRARWHETEGQWQPRCECGDLEGGSWGCYMYRPVRPHKLVKAIPDDERSVFAPAMLAARTRSCGHWDEAILEVETFSKEAKAEEEIIFVPYWAPLPEVTQTLLKEDEDDEAS